MQKVRAVNRTIKDGWMRSLRAEAERYSRILAAEPPHRLKLETKLREVTEKIDKLEQWR
jgi:hypothetical protein